MLVVKKDNTGITGIATLENLAFIFSLSEFHKGFFNGMDYMNLKVSFSFSKTNTFRVIAHQCFHW